MKRMGICSKCKQYKMVQDHHYKGYGTDEVAPYCQSCDQKAHNKAKREGKCKLQGKESRKLTRKSYNKRVRKLIILSSETLEPYVQLYETLTLNLNTKSIYFSSYFNGHHGKKLMFVDI